MGKVVHPVRAVLLGLGTVAALACADSASARVGSPGGPAPKMPLGVSALPPHGFLEYCGRSPAQCAGAGAAEDVAVAVPSMMRRFWQAAFADGAPAAEAAPAAFSTGRYDWSSVFRNARPSHDSAVAGITAPSDTAPRTDLAEASDPTSAAEATSAESAARDAAAVETRSEEPVASAPAAFLFDRSGAALVSRVNRRLNRAIRRAADRDLYGRDDYWERPTGRGARGDCEDYVLAKREALIEAGVSADALSIALVETRWGEAHAVLLVTTDRGEYVLDNLTPWVVRWDRTDYGWRSRQLPGRPLDWVRVQA